MQKLKKVNQSYTFHHGIRNGKMSENRFSSKMLHIALGFEYRRFDYRGFEEQSIFVCGLDVGKPILKGGLVFKVTCEAKTLGQLVQMVACDGCDGCNVMLGRSNQSQLMLSWLVSCISHLRQLYF